MAEETSNTPKIERIPKLASLTEADIGKYVKLHGWVYSVRIGGAGSLCFVDLGDGSTVAPVRCLASCHEEAAPYVYKNSDTPSLLTDANNDETSYSRLTFDEMCATSSLCLGCSVMILGYVAEPPEGTTQALEVKILELFVVGGVADPNAYPIQKSILKKPLALRGHPHSRFRAPLMQQLMQIRAQALFAVHEFFHNEGVPLLDPNIMTANDCEGAGEVFKIAPQMFGKIETEEPVKKKKTKKKKGGEGEEADKQEAPKEEEEEVKPAEEVKAAEVGLTVSSQLPLEAIAMGTGSVYTCQKSFRAEKSDTNKHLAEFLHVEYEEYFITLDDLVDQAERFVKHVVSTVLDVDPIQKSILKKPLALRGHPHSRFRAPLMQQLMQIRAQALFAVHEFFHNEGVPLLDPNIMTANDCEGAGEVFKIAPQMFGKIETEEPVKKKKTKKKKGGEGEEAEKQEEPKEEETKEAEEVKPAEEAKAAEVGLTVSSQLPLEAIAMGTGSVYTCQKSFRAEKSDTNKHLAEFLHVEYEEYFITLDDLVDQAERFVKHVVSTVLDRCQPQYKFLSQKHAA
eukprot:CAMPEP_0113506906 /NCGR_PEP_ID=MMETSP0014_2-20120614/36165_1 /TAXON_ID=2857 /ORGANISM="Nitzschia sp." /LENGTH=567 /DNA_ID=CAMNT_0000402447 /DNA_START=75 /DNA_END=1775 /DNA_ORIENTATION=+ /assembly_acc=CAM_ASM_000159